MGNCLKSHNQISAQDHEEYNNIEQPSDAVADEPVKTSSSSFKLEQESMQKKKMVRIVRNEKDTSLEQLLCAIKLGIRSRISELPEDDGSIYTWRPTLETIPEDRSH
ncbi:uncharacterized protein G2W53_037960 [Senna tora]|uniref:Uncharacterized protein n=1 Tax=Senna tora TaxID=362788 RepID=A0A834SYH3_9FABA|nr:uncharacterized protein G2W53_037960 [Senna tora]